MKQEQVNQIVEELCRLEPGWRGQEPQLRQLVAKLVTAKPAVTADPRFLESLRQQVMAKLPAQAAHSVGLWQRLSHLSRPVYALAGATLALVVAVPLLVPDRSQPSGPYVTGLPAKLSEAADNAVPVGTVVPVGEQAFGSLSTSAGAEGEPVSSESMTLGLGTAEAGYGGGTRTAAPMPEGPQAISVAPPNYVSYRYRFSYDGELPGISDPLQVLRFRSSASPQLSQLVSGLGLIDATQFRDAQAMSLNLVEDREYGYSLYVNYREGSVNISQNHSRWPSPYECRPGEECLVPPQFTEADLLPEAEVVAATDAFLGRYGVDLSAYGQPAMDRGWERQGIVREPSTSSWVPETLQVVYPLQVQGRTVFTDTGRPYGINVSYSLRFGRVVHAGPIMLTAFESSAYPAQTDTAAIRTALARGGVHRFFPEDSDEVLDYDLGQPEEVYLLQYQYQPNGTERLLVPGWAFPVDRSGVDEATGRRYWGDYVVVPLVAESYNQPDRPVMMESRGSGPIEPAPAPALEEPVS